MGEASTALGDLFSAVSNPAALTDLNGWGVAASGERRFLSEALSDYGLVAAFGGKNDAVALTFNSFGFSAYREQKAGLAYSRKLFSKLSFGAKLDYLSVRIPEYGSKHLVTFELGVYAKPTEKLRVGARVYSPLQVQIAGEEDKIPTLFNVGVAWLASEKLTMTADLAKDLKHPLQIRTGVEYQAAKPLYIRAGFSTEPVQASFGIGLKFSGVFMDFASRYNPTLGFSPAISLGYRVSKNAKNK